MLVSKLKFIYFYIAFKDKSAVMGEGRKNKNSAWVQGVNLKGGGQRKKHLKNIREPVYIERPMGMIQKN